MMVTPLRSILVAVLLVGNLATAKDKHKTKNAEFDKNKIGSAINHAYLQVMQEQFNRMANAAKSSKNQSEFLKASFGIDGKSELAAKLDKKFGSNPTPVVTLVKNGIEVTADGHKMTLTLSEKFGELLVDGKEIQSTASGTGKASPANNLFVLVNLLESQAQANMWETVVIEAYSFKEWLIEASKLTTKATAGGVAGGCLFGIGYSAKLENGQALQNCAVMGAVVGTSVGMALTGVLGLDLAIAVGKESKLSTTAANVWNSKIFAKVPGAPQAVKDLTLGPVVYTLGITALLEKAFQPQLWPDGARLICEKSGSFRFESLTKIEGDASGGYSFGDCDTYSLGMLSCFQQNPSDPNENMKRNIRNWDSLPADAQKMLRETVNAENNSRSAVCKKHGEGYSETFRFEKGTGTAIKKVNTAPGAK